MIPAHLSPARCRVLVARCVAGGLFVVSWTTPHGTVGLTALRHAVPLHALLGWVL